MTEPAVHDLSTPDGRQAYEDAVAALNNPTPPSADLPTPDDPVCGARHPSVLQVVCFEKPGPNASSPDAGTDEDGTPVFDVHVHKGFDRTDVHRWEG